MAALGNLKFLPLRWTQTRGLLLGQGSWALPCGTWPIPWTSQVRSWAAPCCCRTFPGCPRSRPLPWSSHETASFSEARIKTTWRTSSRPSATGRPSLQTSGPSLSVQTCPWYFLFHLKLILRLGILPFKDKYDICFTIYNQTLSNCLSTTTLFTLSVLKVLNLKIHINQKYEVEVVMAKHLPADSNNVRNGSSSPPILLPPTQLRFKLPEQPVTAPM